MIAIFLSIFITASILWISSIDRLVAFLGIILIPIFGSYINNQIRNREHLNYSYEVEVDSEIEEIEDEEIYWINKPIVEYSEEAIELGYEGSVVLAVNAINGVIYSVVVEKSSGYKILDDLAISAVYKGKLNKITKLINVTIDFVLED